MPNWVYNDLIITGDYDERARLLKAVTFPRPTIDEVRAQEAQLWRLNTDEDREKFEAAVQKEWEKSTAYIWILQALVPTPAELLNSTSPPYGLSLEELAQRAEKYGAVDWFDWQRMNWGGKWGDGNTKVIREGPRSTTLKYRTAWGPLAEGFVRASAQFPTLHFNCRWKEEDVHAGQYKYKNGELLEETRWRWR